jgi:hypothetical protein
MLEQTYSVQGMQGTIAADLDTTPETRESSASKQDEINRRDKDTHQSRSRIRQSSRERSRRKFPTRPGGIGTWLSPQPQSASPP